MRESYCHERDRRPAHYRKAVAGVEVLVGGEWIVVPEDTIQYRTLEGDPARQPLAMVWTHPSRTKVYHLLAFTRFHGHRD